jgi:hypothetical protein
METTGVLPETLAASISRFSRSEIDATRPALPLPLACPGAVSPTKVYSGCPWKASWAEPSDRFIVANAPLAPDAVRNF